MPPRISLSRKFGGETFWTDADTLKFDTKVSAQEKVKELKGQNRGLKARVVPRTDCALVYIEEGAFISMFGKLPEALPGPSGAPARKRAKKAAKKGAARKRAKKAAKKGAARKRAKKGAKKSVNVLDNAYELDRYYAPPGYLFDRLTKEGQKALKFGVHEIHKLPLKKLNKFYNALAAELVKFDPQFEKEAVMRRHIEKQLQELRAAQDAAMEAISQKFIRERVEVGIREGKFNEPLNKLKVTHDVEDVAYRIFNLLGKARKKWPFTEVVLLKEIQALLRRKYPGITNPTSS
ncbi:MAG: hypothetical protein ACTSU5_22420 [Promethearchaeota archaeon]